MAHCQSLLYVYVVRDIIDKRLCGPDDSWRLFRQLLESVAYIHQRGILHRDLKPSDAHSTRQYGVKQSR